MAGGRKRQAQQRGGSRAREREQLERMAAATALPARADVCVVGGGAAGLACAVTAAEAGASVLVLERSLECGRTILATGNGRCNFCNADLAANNYNHPEFVAASMGEPSEALERILGFWRGCGLSWAEEDGRLYPRSRQAASVRNVLLARARHAGAALACGREVTGATRQRGGWHVRLSQTWDGEERELDAATLVIASGGASGALADALGLALVPDSPVLCGVAATAPAPGLLERLSGRRAHCVATLTRAGRVVMREAGEVLFREYGLSGIVSFNLSRHARPGDAIELDLAPEVDAWEVDKLVADRPGDAHALDGILDPATAEALVGLAGGAQAGGLAWRVAPLVKGLPFRVEGLADTAHAQVTRGGIDVATLDARTLAARGHDGLFACGEALDVDGACGGYNLAWAWASGMRAGTSAARLAQETDERRSSDKTVRAAEAERDARAKRANTKRDASVTAVGVAATEHASTASAPHSPAKLALEGKLS
ncbi:aminoacetone oxidase family FAD-binding enzyme [Parolsenella catena]|uniref:aminoacetone oxidase family FAD-binding enzyme n=1 Tax=Parolsenella catena TaxID=2003188 RepID=UPI002FE38D3B